MALFEVMNMSELEAKFRSSLVACGFRRGEPLLVGFSGGADSLALILLLKKMGIEFTAVHFDHGLRGGHSKGDADWCEAFCEKHSIAFERVELAVVSHRENRESLEEAARRCRLDYWRRQANQDPSSWVGLAHHADDALEDFFLRLARGSNASGLTGLRPYREICGVRIIRPLLKFRKNDLKNWLCDQGVTTWRHDDSNDDIQFRRNAVRHQWLPAIRETLGGDQALFRSLDVLRMDADFLERVAASAIPEDDSPESFSLLHPAILPRTLRYWIRKKTGLDFLPSHAAIERIKEALQNPQKGVKYIPLCDFLQLALDHGRLRITEGFPSYCFNWTWREQSCQEIPGAAVVLKASVVSYRQISPSDVRNPRNDRAYFPAKALPETLAVKNWVAGDRMVPFGHQSEKKVKDIFSQAGIAGDRRPLYPEVYAGETLLWVAGVKRAARFPVGEDTDPVVLLELLG